MQTNPILITATPNASPAPSPKAADARPPEQAFNQVLTREVEQQRKPKAADKGDKADKAEKADKADERKKDADANADPATDATNTATPAAGTQAVKDGTQKDGASAEDKAAGNPADMLAFMASLNQAGIAPEPRPVAAAGIAGAAADTASAALDSARGPAHRKPLAFSGIQAGKPEAAPDAADAARTGTEFGESLQRAATATQGADGLPRQTGAADLAARLDAGAKLQEAPAPIVSNTLPLPPQAALQAVQQVSGNVTEKLTPPVGSAGWDQALGQKIVWMAGSEIQSASLTLNPPDLGPLQVVLSVTNAQANATFIAAQPEVRQALEDAMPKLRDMLGEAGIQLGQANVESGASHSQQQGGFDGGQSRSASARIPGGSEEPAQAPQRIVRTQTLGSGSGRVDTFV
jgi:flagellar hook-length control protein FliK